MVYGIGVCVKEKSTGRINRCENYILLEGGHVLVAIFYFNFNLPFRTSRERTVRIIQSLLPCHDSQPSGFKKRGNR